MNYASSVNHRDCLSRLLRPGERDGMPCGPRIHGRSVCAVPFTLHASRRCINFGSVCIGRHKFVRFDRQSQALIRTNAYVDILARLTREGQAFVSASKEVTSAIHLHFVETLQILCLMMRSGCEHSKRFRNIERTLK